MASPNATSEPIDVSKVKRLRPMSSFEKLIGSPPKRGPHPGWGGREFDPRLNPPDEDDD